MTNLAWLIAAAILTGLLSLSATSASGDVIAENARVSNEDVEVEDVDPYCPILTDDVHGKGELQRTLNVHLVPHTHDDVGWLKTVDQYYYGWNNTIQRANVSQILDSVLPALLEDGSRTFTYVETKFFSMWYASLPPSSRQSLKDLIARGQFSFANGGWCMHDEATSHFMGMIDQTTLGHNFLKKELGVVPTVGWQIDPFGHSATQGGLFTGGLGFDSVYFGRIHYADLDRRREDAECEGLWSSSTDGGSVFWGLTGSYGGNYVNPKGFCFDAYCEGEELVGLSENTLRQRVQNFTRLVGIQANQTKGRNVMLTMGMDFFYSQAERNFRNMDLLIESTKRFLSDGSINMASVFGKRFNKVNIFYSNPQRYTKCKYTDTVHAKTNKKETLSEVDTKYDPAAWEGNAKTGDFFPYADNDHGYWSGYFSSRQGLKRMERVGSSFLHAARQIESMTRLQFLQGDKEALSSSHWDITWSSAVYTLDDAMGIAQHHDAITGTAKQHVAYDYAKRIAEGMSDAGSFAAKWLRHLMFGPQSSMLENLRYCHLLNETTCDVSQAASQDENQNIYVVVYNALAKTRSEVIPLPVDSPSHYTVDQLQSDMEWVAADSTLIPNHNYAKITDAAQFTLYFKANDVPPLGASVFRISKVEEKTHAMSAVARSLMESKSGYPSLQPGRLRVGRKERVGEVSQPEDDLIVSNGVLSVVFDRATGVINSISQEHEGGVTVEVRQEYGFYKSFFSEKSPVVPDTTQFSYGSTNGNSMGLRTGLSWIEGTSQPFQNGGAYIFRPTPDQFFHVMPPRAKPESVIVYETGLVNEVHAEYGNPAWIKQITRLTDGKDYVEVEYVVGPVPIEDDIGKEVVSRYSTNIENDGIFYTDSNAREFMKRKRGDRRVFGHDNSAFNPDLEPVAGNYYPVNAATFIEDSSHSFSVLVDRSQGGSSLSDGSLELMIQRRLLHDDGRGVGEALNETDIGITSCPPYGNATRLGNGVIIKGTHRIMIGEGGAGQARSRMDETFSQPHMFVSSAPKDVEISFHQPGLSMLKKQLPNNVMIVTFAAMEEEGAFLVRLAHQYGTGESDVHSSPATVNLQDLFPNQNIVSITEKTLSGNQDKADWEKRRLQWKDNTGEGHSDAAAAPSDLNSNKDVVLTPLDIRTFEVKVSS